MKPLKNKNSFDSEDQINTSDPSSILDLLNQINSRLNLRDDISDRLDLLVYKIEKMEESQEKILEQVNSISNIIYDPDNGLFSRIKDSNIKIDEKISKVEKELHELVTIDADQKKNLEDLRSAIKSNSENQKKIDDALNEILRWKSNVNLAIKWCVGILTPIIGILLNYVKNFFSN